MTSCKIVMLYHKSLDLATPTDDITLFYHKEKKGKLGFAYESNKPVHHKSTGWIMGSIVERRNLSRLIPWVVSLHKLGKSERIQCSNRLYK